MSWGMLSAHRQDSFNNNSNALGQMTAATGKNKPCYQWYGIIRTYAIKVVECQPERQIQEKNSQQMGFLISLTYIYKKLSIRK